jgi:hypothetical protein
LPGWTLLKRKKPRAGPRQGGKHLRRNAPAFVPIPDVPDEPNRRKVR